MTTYHEGHIKRNPEGNEIAIRTMFDDTNPGLAGMAWLVATSRSGARNAPTSEVESWTDEYVAPPPSE